jgi:hypothetical protein
MPIATTVPIIRYNVWGRIIESLASIGYDNNNVYSMPYDWRLSPAMLEERDGYFTRLKVTHCPPRCSRSATDTSLDSR